MTQDRWPRLEERRHSAGYYRATESVCRTVDLALGLLQKPTPKLLMHPFFHQLVSQLTHWPTSVAHFVWSPCRGSDTCALPEYQAICRRHLSSQQAAAGGPIQCHPDNTRPTVPDAVTRSADGRGDHLPATRPSRCTARHSKLNTAGRGTPSWAQPGAALQTEHSQARHSKLDTAGCGTPSWTQPGAALQSRARHSKLYTARRGTPGRDTTLQI